MERNLFCREQMVLCENLLAVVADARRRERLEQELADWRTLAGEAETWRLERALGGELSPP